MQLFPSLSRLHRLVFLRHLLYNKSKRTHQEETAMKPFRFVILGAAKVGRKFCDAISCIPDCELTAVASKSLQRAEQFAATYGLPRFYDSYEEMLDQEKPDCAYIAVTPNDHFRLAMMCLERKIPVLCEKAMFQNSQEAQTVFDTAKASGVFVMEALWSRFLPTIRKVCEWLEEGRIGEVALAQCDIGIQPPYDPENRYFNPALGGGAAKDITVYVYEIITYVLKQEIKKITVSATWTDSGVDASNQVSIEFEHTLANLMTSFVTNMDHRLLLCGTAGKIVVPRPHCSTECFLYNSAGELLEHFTDTQTKNGFTYEIEEAMRCIRAGLVESPVVPHQATLDCAKLFDMINECR